MAGAVLCRACALSCACVVDHDDSSALFVFFHVFFSTSHHLHDAHTHTDTAVQTLFAPTPLFTRYGLRYGAKENPTISNHRLISVRNQGSQIMQKTRPSRTTDSL